MESSTSFLLKELMQQPCNLPSLLHLKFDVETARPLHFHLLNCINLFFIGFTCISPRLKEEMTGRML